MTTAEGMKYESNNQQDDSYSHDCANEGEGEGSSSSAVSTSSSSVLSMVVDSNKINNNTDDCEKNDNNDNNDVAAAAAAAAGEYSNEISTLQSQQKAEEKAKELYQQGKSLYQDGQFSDSVQCLLACCRILEPVHGKYHNFTLKAYWRLGRSAAKEFHQKQEQQQQQNFQESLPVLAIVSFQRAWRISEHMHGPSHNATTCLIKEIKQTLGTPASASSASSASNSQESCDFERLSRVMELERQGDALTKSNSLGKAAKKYHAAIALETSWLSSSSLSACCADLYCKLALVLRLNGQYITAKAWLEKAVTVYQQQLGPNHPATLGANSTIRLLSQDDPSSAFAASGRKRSLKFWNKVMGRSSSLRRLAA